MPQDAGYVYNGDNELGVCTNCRKVMDWAEFCDNDAHYIKCCEAHGKECRFTPISTRQQDDQGDVNGQI